MFADSSHPFYVKRWVFFCLATLILHLGALNWASRHLARPLELKSTDAGKSVMVNLMRGPEPIIAAPVVPVQPQSVAPRAPVNKPVRPVAQAKPQLEPAPAVSATPTPGQEGGATPDTPPISSEIQTQPVENANPADARVNPNGYQFNIPPSLEVRYAVRKSNRADEKEHPTNGRGVIRFVNQGGGYRIEGEFKFLFFTFFSFTSEGGINQFGLAPVLYSEKRGTRAPTNTHFQQEKRIISFSASTGQFPMSDGAQDRASVLWQLASIVRAEGSKFADATVIEVQVAGERRADLWTFQYKGLESIKLGDRELNALHLMQQPPAGSYERRIDVWLAPRYQFAPVKIVYTEANGNVLEMEMTDVVDLPLPD